MRPFDTDPTGPAWLNAGWFAGESRWLAQRIDRHLAQHILAQRELRKLSLRVA